MYEVSSDSLGQAAKEDLVIELYRSRKIGLSDVCLLLGLETRIQAEEWLGSRGVNWNYALEDLEADRATLSKLFNAEL